MALTFGASRAGKRPWAGAGKAASGMASLAADKLTRGKLAKGQAGPCHYAIMTQRHRASIKLCYCSRLARLRSSLQLKLSKGFPLPDRGRGAIGKRPGGFGSLIPPLKFTH